MKTEISKNLVVIGSSSGGPAALAKVLGGLTKDFRAAIVIVQHIDKQFAQGMADWLGQHSPWPVQVVKPNDMPATGTIWLAGTHDHLVLKTGGKLDYVAEPIESPYRPSVDVFFKSVTQFWSGNVVGVVLTGMGRDGALGLKALRNKGHYTIAQDADSSAVYGMPKAAAALDAAVDVLALDRIAPKLLEVFH